MLNNLVRAKNLKLLQQYSSIDFGHYLLQRYVNIFFFDPSAILRLLI